MRGPPVIAMVGIVTPISPTTPKPMTTTILPSPLPLIAHSYNLRKKGKRSVYRISTRETKSTVFPTKQAAIYGNNAGNLISGS